MSLVVFSDLDGTLLDHEHYSYAAAKPALNKLRQQNIQLILASSKTAMELVELRSQMGFSHCPAIVENGAGLLPAEELSTDDLDQSEYQKLLRIISAAPPQLRENFSGFADWSFEEIGRNTGMDALACEKAAARQFSEPGLWSGTPEELQSYKVWLAANEVTLQQGGRFVTHSFGANKAERMSRILEGYANQSVAFTSLALGDAPNDIAMLEAADHGVIVLNPHAQTLPVLPGEQSGQITRTTLPGPQGWNDAVLSHIAKATQR
ncbi:MAG: HAD-IIB family hydrolase [Hyphomicrobiales bacterium]